MSEETGTITRQKHASVPAKSHVDGFRELIEAKTEKQTKHIRAALFCHPFPDPDAVGSMMGMQWMLSKAFNIESDLFYMGEISHPQNNAICNLLDPQLKRADEDYKPGNYGLHILHDTIPSHAGTGGHQVAFDCVIDHHKDLPNGGYNGLVIHMKIGSCCGVVYKLMEHFCKDEHWFSDNNDFDSKVATAMIAGVITDTDYLVSDDSTEYDSACRDGLWQFRSPNFLKEIVFFKRPRSWADAKAMAFRDVVIDEEGIAISSVGLIPEKQRDLIADTADDILAWTSVHTAIVFGVVGGDRLEGSVRSDNSSLSVPDLCKKLGGKHGQGGGKVHRGAYRYPLAGMGIDPDEDLDVKDKTWLLLKEKETKRLQRLMSK